MNDASNPIIEAARVMLTALHKVAALNVAMTDCGAWDDASISIHPDTINEVCDMVENAISQAEVAGITPKK